MNSKKVSIMFKRKRIRDTLKKNWYYFILGPVFMVLEACGEFILPFINANMINIGVANSDISYILKSGLYMLFFAVFMLITGVVGAYFAVNGASRLSNGIRQDVYSKIQKFSFSDIDEFSTGALITRITNDITQIQNFVQSLLRGTFRSPIMIIGALVMAFTLNGSLAKILLAVVPVLAIIIGIIIFKASPRYTVMQEALDSVNNAIGETVTNERVIKSFVREEYEKEKFAGKNSALAEKSVRALKMMILLQPVSALAINVTTLLIVWSAGKQVMVGDMEIGTLTAFITYLSQVLMALNFLANIVLQGTRANASAKRVATVLGCDTSLNSQNEDNPEKVLNGDIEFKNVSFKYFKTNSENVLKNISFKINSGEIVGIIGSTGSGKTTLVSLIPRLYDADSGEIFVGGKNIMDYSLKNLRDGVSVVLQKNTLFSGSIKENLKWGNENATDEEIVEASKIAQAHSFITSFKDGYDTFLEQGGLNLSGGQRQRVCIARGVIKKPHILILDDSTSAVDTATDAAIRKAFRETLKDSTKIIIAQRINSVIDADKIIVLENGEIAGIGTHNELMKSCEAYKEIYLSQHDKEEE